MILLWLIYVTSLLYWCKFCQGSIYEEGHNFLAVSKTKAYVDKSMLVKSVIQREGRLLITAPKKFLKSTNLDMLRTFLSPNSKNNPEVLQAFKHLDIYQHTQFFEDNFAKHPVVFVDFECGKITSYDEVLVCYKNMIRKAYQEYEKLITSVHLTDVENVLCSLWYGNQTDKITEKDIKYGLFELVRMVKKRMKNKVVFLADNYDSVINHALFRIEDKSKFHDTVRLTIEILIQLVEDNKNVSNVVLCGVSYVSSGSMIYDLSNLDRFSFLDEHRMVKFFGFRLEEVKSLFANSHFQLNPIEVHKAYSLYTYNSRLNGTIFNPHSTLKFLNSKKAQPYWIEPDYFVSWFELMTYPNILQCVEDLLSGKPIKTLISRKFNLQYLMDVRGIYFRHVDRQPETAIFLTHLMEMGYLSFAETRFGLLDDVHVKLSNREVELALLSHYKRFCASTHDLDLHDIKDMSFADVKTFVHKSKHGWTRFGHKIKKVVGKIKGWFSS